MQTDSLYRVNYLKYVVKQLIIYWGYSNFY